MKNFIKFVIKQQKGKYTYGITFAVPFVLAFFLKNKFNDNIGMDILAWMGWIFFPAFIAGMGQLYLIYKKKLTLGKMILIFNVIGFQILLTSYYFAKIGTLKSWIVYFSFLGISTLVLIIKKLKGELDQPLIK